MAAADDGFVTAHSPDLSQPLAARRRTTLSLALTLGAIALLSLLLVSPASAVVEKFGPDTAGLQPRNTEAVFDGNGELGASFANAGGAPVVHASNIYDIFWDPTSDVSYHGDWQEAIDEFLHAVGSEGGSLGNVFAVQKQYTDRSNQPAAGSVSYKGAFDDTNAYPTSACVDPAPFAEGDRVRINGVRKTVCLTDTQIRSELQTFIGQHHLPTGMSTIFYLLTPPGVAVCLDGGGPTGHCSDYAGEAGETSYENSFCSYHGDINPGSPMGDANTVLYATIPWTAGGEGDLHLLPIDRKAAYDCQDGGFDPSAKEKREAPHEKNAKEEEAFTEMDAEEKAKALEAEELAGPRAQEPNQGSCPSLDGSCDHGLADLIVNQIATQQENIVTNPLLDGWQDSAHNEAGDECRNFFAPVAGGASVAIAESHAGTLYNQLIGGGDYYLNTAFDLAAVRFSYPGVPCIPGNVLEPHFSISSADNAGEPIGFNGMESTITLNAGDNFPASGAPSATYPVYTWNFGDGTPTVTGFAPGSPSQNSPETSPCEAPWIAPCAGSEFHSYQYGGSYEVTLNVKDVGGETASITRIVTVNGPARPGTEPTPAGGGGGGSTPAVTPPSAASSPSAAGAGASGVAGAAGPVPSAKQAVASHSLATVLRSGLVVSYSVNEQVAGRFEVLLASSIAKKLGIHGAAATGLAKGAPPQTIIAKAILVTTKAGHGSYKIKLSKTVAARLRKLGKVSLMIRMVVHNPSSPAAATVLSTVKLAH